MAWALCTVGGMDTPINRNPHVGTAAICRGGPDSMFLEAGVGSLSAGSSLGGKRNKEVTMSYVDGFVVPVSRDKIEAYKAQARQAGEVWKEYGALAFVECIGD